MIELANACVRYGGTDAVSALDHVSLSLAPGEVLSVVGANGSGKTTLGRVLCAAELTDDGRVLVDGHDPVQGAEERRAVRRLVGLVCQNPKDQIIAARVFDEVAAGPRNLGLDEAEVGARVHAALGACGLAGFEARETRSLSGGEEQRLAMAGVLAMHPRYLVLDEPGSHLDSGLRAGLRELVGLLARERGLGVAIMTHDAREVLASDAVIVLERGAVAWRGTPQELLLGEERLCDGLLMPCAELVALRGREVGALAGAPGAGVPRVDDGRGGAAMPAAGAEAASVHDASVQTAHELVFREVGFGYGEGSEKRQVFAGLNLRARSGRVLLVCGPSGSGKSTLAALAAGLRKPDSGCVLVDGAPPAPGSVGLALQDPERQFFLDTVYDEVAFAPRNRGLSEPEVQARVEEAMGAVGLDRNLAARDPFSLSGGQARRAGLASVLSLGAAVCVFDEPTAGLDVAGRLSVHAMARNLAAEGCIVVVISHDVEEWADVADDVLELSAAGGAQTRVPAAQCPDTARVAADAEPSVESAAAPSAGRAPSQVLDARVRLVLLLAASVSIFLCSSAPAFALWLGLLLLAVRVSGMGVRPLGHALKPIAFALCLVLCASLVRCDGTGGICLAGPVGLSLAGLRVGVRAVARIALLAGFVACFARTTTASELADALVRLLHPLARLGLPVDALGSALSLAIRFVPIMGDEFQRLQLAQRARGVDFDSGRRLQRLRRWVSVLAPLIIGLFRRADRLAESMAARCYAGSIRVPPRTLAPRDWVALAAGLAIAAAIAAMDLAMW